MSSDFDATEFVDGDLEAERSGTVAPASPNPSRAPTREEVDAKMAAAQQQLAELKRQQEELERERAALEETRRRQMELSAGREEMIQHLTRGVGLLEEAELNARRDAGQMAKALEDFKDALAKIQAINQEAWTKESFNTDLTRALATLDHARMEWNSARVKFPLLSEDPGQMGARGAGSGEFPPRSPLEAYSFGDLWRVGIALTGPLALVILLFLAVLAAILLRR